MSQQNFVQNFPQSNCCPNSNPFHVEKTTNIVIPQESDMKYVSEINKTNKTHERDQNKEELSFELNKFKLEQEARERKETREERKEDKDYSRRNDFSSDRLMNDEDMIEKRKKLQSGVFQVQDEKIRYESNLNHIRNKNIANVSLEMDERRARLNRDILKLENEIEEINEEIHEEDQKNQIKIKKLKQKKLEYEEKKINNVKLENQVEELKSKIKYSKIRLTEARNIKCGLDIGGKNKKKKDLLIKDLLDEIEEHENACSKNSKFLEEDMLELRKLKNQIDELESELEIKNSTPNHSKLKRFEKRLEKLKQEKREMDSAYENQIKQANNDEITSSNLSGNLHF